MHINVSNCLPSILLKKAARRPSARKLVKNADGRKVRIRSCVDKTEAQRRFSPWEQKQRIFAFGGIFRHRLHTRKSTPLEEL